MTFKHEPRRLATMWILVADRSRARVFAADSPGLDRSCEIKDLAHPEGAVHQRETEADGPGRFYESGGPRHAADPPTDFKHRTATDFARQIVQELQAGKDGNEYGGLVIIAPALMLGVLRSELPGPLSQMIVADLDKDLTLANDQKLREEVVALIGAASAT